LRVVPATKGAVPVLCVSGPFFIGLENLKGLVKMENFRFIKLNRARLLVEASQIGPKGFCANGDKFIAELLPRTSAGDLSVRPDDYTVITLDSTAPLEVADLDGSTESILGWVQKYGIPVHFEMPGGPYYLIDGEEKIANLVSVGRMQRDFKDITKAVSLWRWIAESNIGAIQNFLAMESIEDAVVVLDTAISVLSEVVNRGLKEYPHCPQVSAGLGEVKEFVPFIGNPMVHIWNVIYQGILGKKLHIWHYKQCSDCGAWEDLSIPGHRKAWARCPACAAKRKTDLARARQQKKRGIARQQKKRGIARKN
jgi:hypothetical protein